MGEKFVLGRHKHNLDGHGRTERLLHRAKLRRRRRMSKQRKGWRRKQERKRREGDRGNRDVMIPAKDPDPEFDFQLICNSGSGFGCNKRRNPSNCGGRAVKDHIFFDLDQRSRSLAMI